MSTGLLIQYIVLGLIVAASALVVFRKLAPQLTSRWLAAVSMRLSRHDSRVLKILGRRLQPSKGTGDCSDGCSTCGACGPKSPAGAKGEAVPLTFRPRSR
ncbi:DUF6587 family protein [Rhodanobacter hydrolyticus]|uniref:Uncharacterized protein n=1 Tax=Rhodanobacter hydrolyticus TaxID=2250595 RepID=A0ABW8JAC8_9GAMM